MRYKRLQNFTYAFVVSSAFLWFRLQSISTKRSFNPDEAELLAIAKRASINFIPYEHFSTPTHGAPWPYFLALINKLGLPLTIPVAHLLSCLVGIVVSVLLLLRIQKYLGNILGFITVFPFILVWSIGFGDSDFQSLSTELLPVLLITIGVFIASSTDSTDRNILVASCLVGTAAWAKYSFAPISLLVLCVFVYLLQKRRGGILKQMFVVGVSANVIPIVVFGIAIAIVRPQYLIWETFEFTFQYMGQGGLGSAKPPNLGVRISVLGGNVVKCFPLIIMFTVIMGFYEIGSERQRNYMKKMPLGVLIVGMISSFLLWPVFPHYNLLIIGSGVAASLLVPIFYTVIDTGCTHNKIRESNFLLYVGVTTIVLVAMLYAPVMATNQTTSDLTTTRTPWIAKSAMWERAEDKDGVQLSEVCAPKSKVVVWGWSSELYSYYDWMPASRYVNTVVLMFPNEINTNPVKYRENFTREIYNDEPDCIIDATGPSFFPGYGPEKQMSAQMPELWKKLQKTYRQYQFFYDGVNPFEVLVREENIAISE
jgi:hypothetical protein